MQTSSELKKLVKDIIDEVYGSVLAKGEDDWEEDGDPTENVQDLIEEYIANHLYLADHDTITERRNAWQKTYLIERKEGNVHSLYSEGYVKALTEVLEELQ